MNTAKKFLLFGLLPALLFQVIGAYFYFQIWPMETAGKVTYSLTKILLFVWPLLWWKAMSTPLHILPKKAAHEIFLGLASGLALSCALFLIFLVLPSKEVLSAQIHTKAEAYLNLNLGLYIAFSIFLSLAHSLLEEYYWRWFLGKGLQNSMSPWGAITLANVAFSAHHFIVLNALVELPWAISGTCAVFIAGMTWSLLYKRTGSLFSSWISHACVDATIMVIGASLLF